ncbi:MAG: electron transport complex subunit RsxC [Bacteroidetes bacterium]|nr:MAG: electron transport complex subunit RsxC [Bacteroidota bacterium]
MKLKTFRIGGIHPPEQKLSSAVAIQEVPLPDIAVVPLSQHLGAPAKVQVKRGEMVKVGTLLAKGEAFISADIHSPVSGKVLKIEPRVDSSGFRRESVIIEVQGDDWEEDINNTEELIKDITLDKDAIIQRIHDCGIVGLGGATFPSHVKYMIPEGRQVEYLIINGVECEPYITADERLMLEKGEELMVGIRIMMKALAVDKAIIGIENNKPDAIEHLRKIASQYQGISVEPLKVQYPQGGEKQLIDAVLKRQIPSGKLPSDVGCVVNNVGTAYAIYEAVQKNKPLVERIVTVTGKTVGKPSNFRVRLGTPISNLLPLADCDMEKTGKVINGGPMMGKALVALDAPVTKGTSAVLLMKKEESKRVAVQNCIRCGKCMTVCPMGLEPYLLSIIARQGQNERCEQERIMDCIECGSCVYTCPSGRPLLDHIRLGKANTSLLIRTRGRK